MRIAIDPERSLGEPTASAVKLVIGDNILEVVSGFGRYQAFQSFLVLLPVIFTSMSNVNYVFAAADVDYRCTGPSCEVTNATTSDWWISNVTDGICSRPVFNSNVSCDPGDLLKVEACDEWVYDTKNSVIAEFGLACQNGKQALIGTIHNVGVLLSMPLIGYVADKFGRRNAIILSGVSLCVGILKTQVGEGAVGYVEYVVIEFVEALLVTGTYTSCFVLLIELVGTRRRIVGSVSVGIAMNVGEILLSLIVWLFPYWRHFLLITYCTGPIFFIYIILLQESMRWLLINGKSKKAMTLLEKIIKWNHIAVSREIKDTDLRIPTNDKENENEESFSFKLLFSSPIILKRVIMCSCWWFTVGFVYYSLSVFSVMLPGNKYFNFALSAFLSIIGELIALTALDRIGRKKTLMIGFLMTGICCTTGGLTQEVFAGADTAALMLSKLSITTCFNAGYVYTSELMPTSLRASLLGTCSMCARFGSILACLTPLLGAVWRPLPSLLCGASSLFAAVLVLAAPETLNQPLPDTVAQAVQIT